MHSGDGAICPQPARHGLVRALVAWSRRNWAGLALSAIVLAGCSLSLRWVFLVPIYQAPDEPVHLDYALCIYQNGGLFNARGMPPDASPNYYLHPYTEYLTRRVDLDSLVFNPAVKISPDYGTPEFYAALDREAPGIDGVRISKAPSLMRVYPFGYYALLAAWIGLLRQFSDSLVVLFFGARALSVLMLGINLVCIYGILRELHFRSSFALLLTACIGAFPLVTFVSSYIQPDNLSFLLTSLCLYLALMSRRRAFALRFTAALGLAMGALLVTKTHYFLCVALPIAGMWISHLWANPAVRTRLATRLAFAVTPSLLLAAIHQWSIAGVPNYFGPAAEVRGWGAVMEGLKKALRDYYSGVTHASFWGIFGWLDTPLAIVSPRVDFWIRQAIWLATLAIILLTLVRLEQVASRLVTIARLRSLRNAVKLALANPVLNAFFLFTIVMIVLHVRLDNRFGAQGRNWIPFVLPIFLTGLVFAPQALSLVASRRVVQSVLTAGLAVFVAAGSYWAPHNIRSRYFSPLHHQATEVRPFAANMVFANAITWDGRGGDGTGADPYLIFRCPRQFVHGLRITYVLNNPEQKKADMQVFWMREGENTFSEAERTSRYSLVAEPQVRTLTIWINDSIDHFRIDPDARACHFELLEMCLIGPREHAADVAQLELSTNLR